MIFELAPHLNERRMALSHLKTMRSGDVVGYDRRYLSHAMLDAHSSRGVDLMFRLARRAGKVNDAFMDGDQTDAIVPIEVAPTDQTAIRENHPIIEFKP